MTAWEVDVDGKDFASSLIPINVPLSRSKVVTVGRELGPLRVYGEGLQIVPRARECNFCMIILTRGMTSTFSSSEELDAIGLDPFCVWPWSVRTT